jgi:hypothetical protein
MYPAPAPAPGRSSSIVGLGRRHFEAAKDASGMLLAGLLTSRMNRFITDDDFV